MVRLFVGDAGIIELEHQRKILSGLMALEKSKCGKGPDFAGALCLADNLMESVVSTRDP